MNPGALLKHPLLVAGLVAVVIALVMFRPRAADESPIRIGILHSLTGAIAISERSMVDAELLAIEEINRGGGLLGRQVEAVVADGQSDWPTFAREAERLISEEKVVTVFGCWTSASRKTVKPVFEQHDHLLVYPMAYEGLEQSRNIAYIGAAPNQQVTPALTWGVENLGKRVFLVGSDYVWPRTINAIMKDMLPSLGAELVGESYVFFGSTKLDQTVAKIKAAAPDFVISSVVGDSNPAFYRALREAGISAESTPVLTFSIGESELLEMDPLDVGGHFAAWSYLQSLPGQTNQEVIARFRERFGAERVTSDVIATAYSSVLLWAQAVEQAQSIEVDQIRTALYGQSIAAPEGIISVDAATGHAWRSISIGRINKSRGIDQVWALDRPIRPVPFPISRTPAAWRMYLDNLYQAWGNSWANPEESAL